MKYSSTLQLLRHASLSLDCITRGTTSDALTLLDARAGSARSAGGEGVSLTVVDESVATVGAHGGLVPVRRAEDDADKPVDEQDEKEIAQFEARALPSSRSRSLVYSVVHFTEY